MLTGMNTNKNASSDEDEDEVVNDWDLSSDSSDLPELSSDEEPELADLKVDTSPEPLSSESSPDKDYETIYQDGKFFGVTVDRTGEFTDAEDYSTANAEAEAEAEADADVDAEVDAEAQAEADTEADTDAEAEAEAEAEADTTAAVDHMEDVFSIDW